MQAQRAGVFDASELWKGSGPRLDAKHAREEVAHTHSRVQNQAGRMLAGQEKDEHVRERMRTLLRRHCCQTTDVLEESAGPRLEVGDAKQMAPQEAKAQASQGPAAVPAELSTGSVAQASSASKREIESRELGAMGAFDMDIEVDNPEVRVPRKSRMASLTIAGN